MSTSNLRILFVFPGQGSQYPGMGSDLCRDHPAAGRVYAEANEVLGYDLTRLSFEGPAEQLNLTRHTQPALLTHAIACLTVFKELTDNRVTPVAAAGHSLGEYAALVAAGALSFANALQLVQKRGEFMGRHGEGEMLAFPVDLASAQALAEKHYCAVAARNLPEQNVVGGRTEDLDRLTQEASERFPRKRPARLKTEGAFHTYLMIEAAKHFRPVLDAAELGAPAFPVLSNYTGGFHESDPATIKARLFFQLFHPVRWFDNLTTALADNVTAFIEFGGGLGEGALPADKRPNLEGIIKKTLRGAGREAHYWPVISSRTLDETTTALRDII